MLSECNFLELLGDGEGGNPEGDSQDFSHLLINNGTTNITRGQSFPVNSSGQGNRRGLSNDRSQFQRNSEISPIAVGQGQGFRGQSASSRSSNSFVGLSDQGYTSLLADSVNESSSSTPRGMQNQSINQSTPMSEPGSRTKQRAGGSAGVTESQAQVNRLNRVLREKTCEKHCSKEVVIVEYLENLFKTMTLVSKDDLEKLRGKDVQCKALEQEIERLKKVMKRGESDVTEALGPKLGK